MKKIFSLAFLMSLLFSLFTYAQPPMMGWASWNANGTDINETLIKQTANYMVSLGLNSAGYNYVNIDDGYFGGRDANGNLQYNSNFPNGMKSVADYIHSKGLYAGIYSDMGSNTCSTLYGNYGDKGKGVGLYGHESQDLNLFFNTWGYDYIKVDYCGGQQQGLDPKVTYTNVSNIIKNLETTLGRDITYNVCRWTFPGTWVMTVADSWRMHGDITNTYGSIKSIIEDNLYLAPYASWGHYNDMDMLQVGRGMSNDEEKTHFGLWAIMASPLMIGCNLNNVPATSLAIIKNSEVIAVNQDSLGLQGELIGRNDDCLVVAKPIEKRHGAIRAVALMNENTVAKTIRVNFKDLWIGSTATVRDLWNKKDLGTFTDYYEVSVPAHGAAMLKIVGDTALDKTRYQGEYAYMNKYSTLTTGGAQFVRSLATASGGYKMTSLGKTVDNWAEYRDVYSTKGGKYTLQIYYYSEINRSLYVYVNGHCYIINSMNSGGLDKRATVSLPIELNAGNNVIRLANPSSAAPDIDKFELIPDGGTAEKDNFDIEYTEDISSDMPQISTTDKTNEYWFYIMFSDASGVIQDMGNNTDLMTKGLFTGNTSQMWKLITNSKSTNSYKYFIVNKNGRGMAHVASSQTSDGFYQSTSDSSKWASFKIVSTTNGELSPSFELERDGSNGRHVNQFGGAGYDHKISEWTANDHGNPLRFVPAISTNTVFSGTLSMKVNGVNRSTLIYVPSNVGTNRPLLLSLHGRWGSGNDMKNTARFEAIADTAHFIVAYPDGLPQPVLGGNTGWDAGGSTDNDIAFFKAIRDSMSAKYGIDKKRVYITGFSLGGMETYHAANVAADDFAAFASCSGYPLNEYHRYYTGLRPVPFLHIHGKADDFVKYDSVAIVVDNWVARNGCNPVPAVTTKTGVYTRSDYAADNGGFNYLYYALDGVGHEYKITDAFNTSNEMWKFVSRFRLDDTCDRTMKWNPNIQMQEAGVVPAGWVASVDGITTKPSKGLTTGPRTITFNAGGEYNTGFYFCTNLSKGYIAYGSDPQRPIQLSAGTNSLSFCITGVKPSDIDRNVVFTAYDRKTGKSIINDTIKIETCLSDNTMSQSTRKSYMITKSSSSEYMFKWTIDGKSTEAVISGISLNASNLIIDDIPTVTNSQVNPSSSIYDINGFKVKKVQHGKVYILNGKKKIIN